MRVWGPGIQGLASWVSCLGCHQAEVKVFVLSEAQGLIASAHGHRVRLAFGRIPLLLVYDRVPCFCWLSEGNCLPSVPTGGPVSCHMPPLGNSQCGTYYFFSRPEDSMSLISSVTSWPARENAVLLKAQLIRSVPPRGHPSPRLP